MAERTLFVKVNNKRCVVEEGKALRCDCTCPSQNIQSMPFIENLGAKQPSVRIFSVCPK